MECGPDELEGMEGGDPHYAKEVGVVVLDEGMGPDLIASIAKAWERATRKVAASSGGVRIPVGKLSLRGKARKLKARVPEFVGD